MASPLERAETLASTIIPFGFRSLEKSDVNIFSTGLVINIFIGRGESDCLWQSL